MTNQQERAAKIIQNETSQVLRGILISFCHDLFCNDSSFDMITFSESCTPKKEKDE